MLVYSDFVGQIPVSNFLHYLDGYPLYLPARFHDKIACYTKVFIISELPLEKIYWKDKHHNKFLKKIDKYCDSDGNIIHIKKGG